MREVIVMTEKITKTDEEWRQELTPEQYRVLREKGTERPFTGEYNETDREGVYKCAACGNSFVQNLQEVRRQRRKNTARISKERRS